MAAHQILVFILNTFIFDIPIGTRLLSVVFKEFLFHCFSFFRLFLSVQVYLVTELRKEMALLSYPSYFIISESQNNILD